MAKKTKKGDILLFILEKLLELGSLPFEVFEATTTHGGFGKRTLGAALSGARMHGYVTVQRKSHHPLLVLTRKGLMRTLLEKSKIISEKPWDKKWRIIIFDVPESRRGKRDFLRRQLGLLGFQKLHKSVWVSPHPIPKEFVRLLWELKIKIYTRFIVAEHIDYEKDLLKKFGLPG